ncbi:hypothetical protein vseg_016938 [Gypsophila vaccaria]
MDANQGALSELYESVKPIAWVVSIKWKSEEKSYFVPLTAYAIREDGYLMTCAHGGWDKIPDRVIEARQLGDNVKYRAEVVAMSSRCDMCLLKIEATGLVCGKFGSGKLEVGETVMLLGHPYHHVGSGMFGRVAYPCPKTASFSTIRAKTCETYKSREWKRTPKYRIMGHFWNEDVIERAENDAVNPRDVSFEKRLYAQLPMIQMTGLVGGYGASGGPIFNLKKQIVGMYVMNQDGHEIGIHVSALKMFRKYKLRKCKGECSSKSEPMTVISDDFMAEISAMVEGITQTMAD